MALKHGVVYVVQKGGDWAVKKPNAERASGVFETQQEAIDRAQELAGAGTIRVKGRDGKWRKLTPFD